MAVINIDYDDGNKQNLGYKSVEVLYGKNTNEKKVFDSGNFVKDWFNCIKFCMLDIPKKEYPVMFSSSVDNFIMDGALYDSAYFIYENSANGEHLKYGNEWDGKGIEHFVPRGTKPTWKELKEMCK